MIAWLYRYPHPKLPGVWIYCGQERYPGKRDYIHRKGKLNFGRRFKKKFPKSILPQPVREQVEVKNQLELNELETIWIFRFHTWHGYEHGMNIILPGGKDYENMGKLGGPKGGPLGAKRAQVVQKKNKVGFYNSETQRKNGIKGAAAVHRKKNKEGKSLVGIKWGHDVQKYLKKNGLGLYDPKVRKMGNLAANKNGAGSKGVHTRWHTNRGVKSDNCRWCKETS